MGQGVYAKSQRRNNAFLIFACVIDRGIVSHLLEEIDPLYHTKQYSTFAMSLQQVCLLWGSLGRL